FAKFIQMLTGVKEKVSFKTGAGIITAYFKGENVSVNMTQPKDLELNIRLPIDGAEKIVHFINTGVPHTVMIVEEVEKVDVKDFGSKIRWHNRFKPKGTNVNFAEVKGQSDIRVRTYERGVEDETLACGTGITASAIIVSKLFNFNPPIKVLVQSGDTLDVNFDKSNDLFKNVVLTGPAEFVFNGKVDIN
ncbi:MAG TPA: diaminopimelate epimerase, partial [Verrucomicrobiota bacterium]|nr:diaminopimelate epimerase [Verrucomicrobiota bacterium]